MTRQFSLQTLLILALTAPDLIAADKLLPNGSMLPGDALEFSGRDSKLVFTRGGELVHMRRGQRRWSSATHGLKPKSVHLQTDGNTIIHFQDGLLWALDDGGHPNATMELTPTDVVMRNAAGDIYWRGSDEIGRGAWGRIAVYDGKMQWRFHQCKIIGKVLKDVQGFMNPVHASGVFVGFDVEPNNNGNKPVSVRAPRLVDSKGREFESSFEASLRVPRPERFDAIAWPHKVNPRAGRAAKLIYDVPLDAGLLSMKFEAIELDGSQGVTVELPVTITPKILSR